MHESAVWYLVSFLVDCELGLLSGIGIDVFGPQSRDLGLDGSLTNSVCMF